MAEISIRKFTPMETELKTKKFRIRESEDPVGLSYEKLLRKHDKTRKVYDINPYAEVYRFRENLYCIYSESLDGMGDPWSFLILGPEKAMLIDTGFGLGDLKGLVKELAGEMPLVVVNTHYHFDHAYGNYQFERVYCHEYEVPAMKTKLTPHVWDYLFDEGGKCVWTEFDRGDLIPYKEYEIVGYPDGYSFDLGGGYEVEMVHLPGHTAGHAAYLDKRNRILFAGDAACIGNLGITGDPVNPLYGKAATVTRFRDALAKLTARNDEFDTVFPSHSVLDLDKVVLSNILETCDKILDNPAACDSMCIKVRNGVEREFCNKMIYRAGNLTYSMETV